MLKDLGYSCRQISIKTSRGAMMCSMSPNALTGSKTQYTLLLMTSIGERSLKIVNLSQLPMKFHRVKNTSPLPRSNNSQASSQDSEACLVDPRKNRRITPK